MTHEYDWITDEMYDAKLREICHVEGSDFLVTHVTGVYEAVREYFNNDVIQELEDEREERIYTTDWDDTEEGEPEDDL